MATSAVERASKWAKENPERRKEISREWVRRNKDKVKQYQQRYRKEEPIKYLVSLAKRRAKKKI